MEKPTQDELKAFIAILDQLESFEAQQRRIRGYGAFKETDLPIPVYIKTRNWLCAEAGMPVPTGVRVLVLGDLPR